MSAASPGWHTLKDLDLAAALPKGSAFRAFKRLEPGWREDREFRVLRPERDAAEIEALRAAGRVYRSSRAVIVLGDAAAAAVRVVLAG